MSYATERATKRAERARREQLRVLASPVSHAEMSAVEQAQFNHIASLALAMEVLEEILVDKHILKPDQLMARMKELAEQKMEQAEAALATQGQAQELLSQFRSNAAQEETTNGR